MLRTMHAKLCRVLSAVCFVAGSGYTLHAQDTSTKDLLAGLANPSRWLTNWGDYTGQRFSPLTQVTPASVGQRAAGEAADVIDG